MAAYKSYWNAISRSSSLISLKMVSACSSTNLHDLPYLYATIYAPHTCIPCRTSPTKTVTQGRPIKPNPFRKAQQTSERRP